MVFIIIIEPIKIYFSNYSYGSYQIAKKREYPKFREAGAPKTTKIQEAPKISCWSVPTLPPRPTRSLTFCCSCAAGVESSSLFCSQRAFQTVVLLSFSLFLLTVADFVPVIVVAVALELVFSLMKIPRVWKRGREFGRAQPESQKANYSRC